MEYILGGIVLIVSVVARIFILSMTTPGSHWGGRVDSRTAPRCHPSCPEIGSVGDDGVIRPAHWCCRDAPKSKQTIPTATVIQGPWRRGRR